MPIWTLQQIKKRTYVNDATKQNILFGNSYLTDSHNVKLLDNEAL